MDLGRQSFLGLAGCILHSSLVVSFCVHFELTFTEVFSDLGTVLEEIEFVQLRAVA